MNSKIIVTTFVALLIALLSFHSLQAQMTSDTVEVADIIVTIDTVDIEQLVDTTVTADTSITFDGTTINVSGNGATVSGNTVTITNAGTYSLSGVLSDGQVVVDTEDTGLVTLILDGVNLNSSTGAPINIKNAESAAILLPEGTDNYVSDATSYVYENLEDDEPNAAVFSDDDLTIYGAGSLTVMANYNDGIASKDSLTILDSVISVMSVDDGIRGKDYLLIDGAQITLNVTGDGLKSDNKDDLTVGYINILSGVFNITSGGDAVTAQSALNILDGSFTLTSGGGSSAYIDESLSAKGLKSVVAIVIDGGTFIIDSADDTIHSNDTITINNGTFTLASGDDGIHADANVEINGGVINITTSYEGIEGAIITINNGDIQVVASDDGLNVAGGADGSGFGGRGGGGFSGGNYFMYINGGTITVNAEGDGLDANGSIVMTGGTVIVNGPTMSMNGTLDYDGSFQITGGTLIGAGSSGMMQAPDTSSTQYSLAVAFTNTLSAGTQITIQNSAGETVLSFTPTKTYQSIVFSSPDLVGGETYTIYQGDTAYTSLTLSSITTQSGGGANGGPGGNRGSGRRP